MDIGGWLKGIGFERYEAAFRDNGIDEQVLPHLTVEDLKEIGVATVGERRKLLAAIAALASPIPPRKAAEEGAQRSGAAAGSQPSSAPPKPAVELTAERRPIAIMFCDLVGSTALAARLDPEDWRNLVSAYLDAASAAVTGLGGHVLKRLGDGLMALFGYPQAQENDAERAVRAALAIHRALADLNARNAAKGAPKLAARIGLELGPVVVDTTGEVFGEAPNVAARVQGAAEPGSVLVTANVQRQVAGLFVAEDQGAHDLKGVSGPISLYRIARASGGGRRGRARVLGPLVGRSEELDLLMRRWERARSGAGQFVQIVGEPGIGKSRLVEEFRNRLGETSHTWVEWSSSQLLQNTPLHPIAEWGRQRFGDADTDAGQRFADLENTLQLIGLDPVAHAPLLAPLVDIPLPPGRAADLSAEELRRKQLSALIAWILAGARSQPIALAFEDLHWADPTSLDLLQALAERGAQAPLLIVATTRPDFRAPWGLRANHSVIALSPLDRADVALMVGELAARHALSKEVVEGVSERTGGVPLFVEEVTRLLLERGEVGGLQAIPPTLQQSLAARLDRLGEAREVAQIGAVLGRDFSFALLAAVGGVNDRVLQSSLDRLVDVDLLFVEGAGAQATYRFKHALIQDAAYDSLLKSRRQALHQRAGEALLESRAEPEAIAHHFTEAGLDDLAIEWWGKAGDQALRRSAFQEAIAHLGKAIALADKAAEAKAVEPSGERARLQVAYGNALIQGRGHGAPETRDAFARLRDKSAGDKDAPERLAADYGLWVGSFVRGELPAMRAHAEAFLGDVQARPDSAEAAVAHRTVGGTHWFAGEYGPARNHLERALALFVPGRDDDLAFRFGYDAGVVASVHLAFVLWPMGELRGAVSLIGDAQARSAGLSHVATRVHANMHAAMFELMRGEASRAAPHAIELARLTREHDLPMWRAYAAFLEGFAKSAGGAPRRGLEEMRSGAELLRKLNVLTYDGLIKIALAEAEARAGDAGRALVILDDALATSERTGHSAFDAELHRARGETLLKGSPTDSAAAEQALQHALSIAEQQGARGFGLRAALSLAKLYQSTDRHMEAHAVLAPALEGLSLPSPSGRRVGDEGYQPDDDDPRTLTPDPSPGRERGDIPTPEMPEIAEAQALFAALAETDEVKAEQAQRQRRLRLQVGYGNALIAARGFGAPETTEAFAKARESATGDKDAPDRLAANYGLWVGSFIRGELSLMRACARDFLGDVAARPDSREAGVAHRSCGSTHHCAGEYVQARGHLERALDLFHPGQDDDLAFRFGLDEGVAAMACLALALWPLGEIDRAASLIERMVARMASLAHVTTLAIGSSYAAQFAMLRGDRERGRANALEFARLAREHNLSQFRLIAMFFEGWARAENDLPGGLEDMRRSAELLREQKVLFLDGLIKNALAEAEARAGDLDRAIATLDETLATCESLGLRQYEAELRRTRGELLWKRDPANFAPAAHALQSAIAVAKQQGTRSFELRAALALAKLYQSTGRTVEAHAILAPALEGFPLPSHSGRRAWDGGYRADYDGPRTLTPDPSPGRERGDAPTPEMPEIAEAQALLAALAETDQVKEEVARRQRRLHLQTAYGQAMMWAKGFASEETRAVFSRATELAAKTDDFADRFAAAHFQWTWAFVRGELQSARELELGFLKEAEDMGRAVEAGVALRGLALACYEAGEFLQARTYCERALEACELERDRETQERFHDATGPIVMSVLSVTMWQLGDVEGARERIDQAIRRANELGHAPSMAHPLYWKTQLEILRGDAAAALTAAEALDSLGREQGTPFWRATAQLCAGWARGRLYGAAAGAADLRRAMAERADQGARIGTWHYDTLLAQLEAEALGAESALARIDEAIALGNRVEYRCNLAFPYLLRGELLLKRDPSCAAPAEEALRSALAIAKEQGARSWGLRASLSLAKLYRSTGRPAEAHAVLAPALEGFSPTPEMPEIGEAQALLAALADSDAVKADAARRERWVKLQTTYGQALLWSKGFVAGDAKAAFARAADLAESTEDAAARFAVHTAHWLHAFVRGEFARARDAAETCLREAEAEGDFAGARLARLMLALILLFQGDLIAARSMLERDAVLKPDEAAQLSFGIDTEVRAQAYLALTDWHLGDIDRARELIDQALLRAEKLGQPATIANALHWKTILESRRGDVPATAMSADALLELIEEHGIEQYAAIGRIYSNWAHGRLLDPQSRATGLRQALEEHIDKGNRAGAPWHHGLLAELEAEARGAESALALIDQGLGIAQETGEHYTDAYLHRLRGDALLKRDSANPGPAEDAYRAAVAIARNHGARSFGLRAALSLAKLYRSTGRPAEAHAVLAPALEGFSPTPEMPEIGEAQALLAELVETDEGKGAGA